MGIIKKSAKFIKEQEAKRCKVTNQVPNIGKYRANVIINMVRNLLVWKPFSKN